MIITDEAYDDFFAGREAFIRLLGEPIFLEVFSDYGFDRVFFTFPDGVECELMPGLTKFCSAYGGLQDLRLSCMNLARLRENFSAAPEGYEKVEQALSVEQLEPLKTTCCPLERSAMLQAALVIVRFYQELAVPLAQTHGIAYPIDLERVMYERLEALLVTV